MTPTIYREAVSALDAECEQKGVKKPFQILTQDDVGGIKDKAPKGSQLLGSIHIIKNRI
jgi:hypothetical protein